jgi:hypothetical protein
MLGMAAVDEVGVLLEFDGLTDEEREKIVFRVERPGVEKYLSRFAFGLNSAPSGSM